MLQIGLLFVLGHIVLFVTVRVLGRFLRREPNLLARRDAVFELNHRPARVEAGEGELATSRLEAAGLERRAKEVQAAVMDRVPLDDPPTTQLGYTLLAGILGELEALLLFLLSGPVPFSACPWAHGHSSRPSGRPDGSSYFTSSSGRWSLTSIAPPAPYGAPKIGAACCGAAVILGAWLTLSGRNIGDANLVEQLVGLGLMLLAVLLSFTAAFCTIVATTLLEAQHHERDWLTLNVFATSSPATSNCSKRICPDSRHRKRRMICLLPLRRRSVRLRPWRRCPSRLGRPRSRQTGPRRRA